MKEHSSMNFNLKILLFSALVASAYFFIDELEYLAIVAAAVCIYDAFKLFTTVKNRDGLKIIALFVTIMAIVIIGHMIIANGIDNPVPVFILFIITNLFFIYNIILYICYKFKKSSLVLLVALWILNDSIPILMIFILSAGLSS